MNEKNKLTKFLRQVVPTSWTREHKIKYSDAKQEEVVVIDRYHRNSWVQPIWTGKFFTSLTHPAVDKTTFHGSRNYIVGGRETYEAFKEGEKAVLTYQEVYRQIYEDKNRDGKKEMILEELIGYEVLDIKPLKSL
jgi:hypothetical protein